MTVTYLSESVSTKIVNPQGRLHPVLVILSMTLALLAAGAGYGRFRFGSVSSALAFVRGERLLVEESNKAINQTSGGAVEIPYSVTNWTVHKVKLIGMDASCTCTAINGMPRSLAASETKVVTATVNTSGGNEDLFGSIRLFTDDSLHPEIKLAYSVRTTISKARQAK